MSAAEVMQRIRCEIVAHDRGAPGPYSGTGFAPLKPANEDESALPLLDVDALFAPLAPVPWLVRSLDIAPGAPVLVAGYGFSGKTLAAQSMALSVAGGGAVWGSLALGRRGRVVHLDYEQGARLTSERYQRLARAMDLDVDALRGLLAVACLPALHLSDTKASDVLCRALDGCVLGIFDSLRASAPEVDENSSEVRRVLDVLTLVSEKTGCVPLVIHHARKPREDAPGGARMAIRGSSAIFDACSSVLVFDGPKGEPVTVTHDKARVSGICSEDIALEVRDVELGGDPRGGLEVRVVGCEPVEVRQAARARARVAELDDAVLDFVRRNPGATVRAVRGNVEGTNATKDGALERLKASARIDERPGPKGARTFWPALGGSPDA
jgi:hypothetical protein